MNPPFPPNLPRPTALDSWPNLAAPPGRRGGCCPPPARGRGAAGARVGGGTLLAGQSPPDTQPVKAIFIQVILSCLWALRPPAPGPIGSQTISTTTTTTTNYRTAAWAQTARVAAPPLAHAASGATPPGPSQLVGWAVASKSSSQRGTENCESPSISDKQKCLWRIF